jgi:hypothetical protein
LIHASAARNFSPKDDLPHALVVSVHAKNLDDLYCKIVRKYDRQLKISAQSSKSLSGRSDGAYPISDQLPILVER